MKRKITLLLLLMIAVSFTGCETREESNANPAAETSDFAPQEQTSGPEIVMESSGEQLETENKSNELAVNSVKVELTVQKNTNTQESVLEEVSFRLSLPENMTVEYDNKTPFVLDGDIEYLRTSSMSSGVTEDMIMSRKDQPGVTVEKMNINDYNTILVMEPVEYPTSGFDYTYYIMFDDNSVLPLTFFSQTDSDIVKQEFSGVAGSFELV